NVFHSGSIDNVNVFSGDPGIVIPLGPEYTLGPNNSWQLKAYYSSKLWFFDQQCGADPTITVHHAYLRGSPTIGAGWTLNLGYINAGTPGAAGEYLSPDGGKHKFTSMPSTAPWYSTDGTHLRVNYTTTPTARYVVEFPDGTRQEFAQQYIRP